MPMFSSVLVSFDIMSSLYVLVDIFVNSQRNFNNLNLKHYIVSSILDIIWTLTYLPIPMITIPMIINDDLFMCITYTSLNLSLSPSLSSQAVMSHICLLWSDFTRVSQNFKSLHLVNYI